MQHVVIVIHLMLVLGLIGAVLLQRSEGGGLGIGSSGGFMSSRGTANVLTRATAIIAGCFFATSLIPSIIAGLDRKPGTLLQGSPVTSPQVPGVPSAPIGAPTNNLLDSLRQQSEPPAPSGPQAPRSQ